MTKQLNAHLTEAELQERLHHASKQVELGKQYQHYKGGLYTVTDLLIIEANNEVGVVYRADYGNRLKFCRALSVWSESVEHEGKTMPRFVKVES